MMMMIWFLFLRNLKAKAITRRWDDSQYALLNSSVFRRLRNWGTVRLLEFLAKVYSTPACMLFYTLQCTYSYLVKIEPYLYYILGTV